MVGGKALKAGTKPNCPLRRTANLRSYGKISHCLQGHRHLQEKHPGPDPVTGLETADRGNRGINIVLHAQKVTAAKTPAELLVRILEVGFRNPAKAGKLLVHGNVVEAVEPAEDAEFAQLGDAGQESEAELPSWLFITL